MPRLRTQICFTKGAGMETLRWYQPDPNSIDSWELQSRRAGEDWHWIEVTAPVETCSDCFLLVAELRDGVQVVRARAISLDGNPSEWSNVIGVPEPEIGSMLSVAVVLIFLVSMLRKILTLPV